MSAPRRASGWRRACAFASLALALVLRARRAGADACTPTGSRSPPLCRNDFDVDLYQGPVLAPVRVMGMGGAFAAVAEGAAALGQNAAAAAVRSASSATQFDYDLTLGVYLPGAFGSTDFDNRGEAGLNAFTLFYTAGAVVQWGPFGIGVLADYQRYGLGAQAGGLPSTSIDVGRGHLAAGVSLLGDQVSIGGGARGVRVSVNTLSPGSSERDFFLLTSENVLSMSGYSPEVGVVVRPDWAPYRLGATVRLPVTAAGDPTSSVAIDAAGVRRAAGLALPARVHWPWEVEAGVALSAGPRPLNPRFVDPEGHKARARDDLERQRRQRAAAQRVELEQIADPIERARREVELAMFEAHMRVDEDRRLDRLGLQLEEERRARFLNWPRARILIVAEAHVTGPTARGVSLQSFLRQEDVASGERVSVEPRLGIEGEPLPDRLVARVGTYLEPSRYRIPPGPGVLSGSRQHFTFGLEVRAFTSTLLGFVRPTPFSVSFTGDLAPRYQNVGLSVGTWR